MTTWDWTDRYGKMQYRADFDEVDEYGNPRLQALVRGEEGLVWEDAIVNQTGFDRLYSDTSLGESYDLFKTTEAVPGAEYADTTIWANRPGVMGNPEMGPVAEPITEGEPEDDVYFGVSGASNPIEGGLGLLFGGGGVEVGETVTDVVTHPAAGYGAPGLGLAIVDTAAGSDIAPDVVKDARDDIAGGLGDVKDMLTDVMPLVAAMLPMMLMGIVAGIAQSYMPRGR